MLTKQLTNLVIDLRRQLILQMDDFDLNELIIERVEDMRQVSPRHKITLKLEKLIAVLADRERIGQVLTT